MKEPKCKLCGGPHYKTWCPNAPRKQIARTPIKRASYEETIAKARKAAQKPSKVKVYKLSSRQRKSLKHAKIASQSKNYRATLIRKADRVFSLYIRRKDAINDIARCVTCGKQDHYKSMQNGHFISRRVMALRFEEINCEVQCPNCNINLSGNLSQYKKYLVEKHGALRVEALQIRAKQGGKLTTSQIEAYIEKYENLLKTIN